MLSSFEWACLFEYHNSRSNEVSDKNYELLYAIGDIIVVTNIIDLCKIEVSRIANKNIKETKKHINNIDNAQDLVTAVNNIKLYLNILKELKTL